MPKSSSITPPPALDMRALALVGARLQLQQLLDEQQQIVTTFPELRPASTPGAPTKRAYTKRTPAPPRDGEHTCPYCARVFALAPAQLGALRKNPDATIACARPQCRRDQKRDYMREYLKRTGKTNGNGHATGNGAAS